MLLLLLLVRYIAVRNSAVRKLLGPGLGIMAFPKQRALQGFWGHNNNNNNIVVVVVGGGGGGGGGGGDTRPRISGAPRKGEGLVHTPLGLWCCHVLDSVVASDFIAVINVTLCAGFYGTYV